MKVKEPEINAITCKSDLIHILNWYHSEKSKDDAKQYIIDYCYKNQPNLVSKAEKINVSNVVPTYGWIARLLIRGLIDAKGELNLVKYIQSIDLNVSDEPKLTVKKYTKPEFDTEDFIGFLEEKVDRFMLLKEAFDINDEIKAHLVPLKALSQVKEWAERRIKEFDDYEFISEDEGGKQVVEYTYNLTPKQLQKLIQNLTIVQVKKAKKVIKKKVDANKQVSKLKYLTEFGDYKSINPVHIVGAKLCVTYNTKNNVISILKNNVAGGLFVKGTSIYNFDEKLGKKKLRNPVMNLKNFTTCPKDDLIKLYDSIKSKASKLSGQMTEHTIILRVE